MLYTSRTVVLSMLRKFCQICFQTLYCAGHLAGTGEERQLLPLMRPSRSSDAGPHFEPRIVVPGFLEWSVRKSGPGVACDRRTEVGENSLGAVTPGETLGTLYTFGVGSNKTKQHRDRCP